MISVSPTRVHPLQIVLMALGAAVLAACSDPQPVSPERYREPDRLFDIMAANVAASGELEKIVEIDHSRLAAAAGGVMPPARVLLFSDPVVETELIRRHPPAALDLPLRALAYEAVPEGEARVIFNTYEYVRSRHALSAPAELGARYRHALETVLRGIDPSRIAAFEDDAMQPDGIVTLASPFDFSRTRDRLVDAIDAQDDTVHFGVVDFQQRAGDLGVEIPPTLLILFGGPAPGARAMAEAPTLGLDAFCQKLLVWESEGGTVRVSFNDLTRLAERQKVPKSMALRVINHRLDSVFRKALTPD